MTSFSLLLALRVLTAPLTIYIFPLGVVRLDSTPPGKTRPAATAASCHTAGLQEEMQLRFQHVVVANVDSNLTASISAIGRPTQWIMHTGTDTATFILGKITNGINVAGQNLATN